jgi:hypothetical protein
MQTTTQFGLPVNMLLHCRDKEDAQRNQNQKLSPRGLIILFAFHKMLIFFLNISIYQNFMVRYI